jgi:hypothetical protein
MQLVACRAYFPISLPIERIAHRSTAPNNTLHDLFNRNISFNPINTEMFALIIKYLDN